MQKHYRSLLGMAILGSFALSLACASNRTNREELNDRGITSKVTAKLTADPEINPFKIDVDTLDGVVTLRGEVKHESVRAEAEKLALATSGVRGVVNRIEIVAPGSVAQHPVGDAWITAKIKTKLAADPQLNPFNIDVDTQHGIVTLSGRVANPAARDEVEKLARATQGVKSVRNELEVSRPS
jgi:hyperosmotically inducible periplasmic protein